MRSRSLTFFVLLVSLSPGCSRDPSGKGAGGGQGEDDGPKVTLPKGYHDLAWGTARDAVATAHPDARPGKRDPTVLVRDVTLEGKTATEAYFFDASSRLVEVEIRYVPKRTPREAAELTRAFDKSFGPHDVPLADENQYQAAWIGEAGEVRLTYDLREQIAFGPVVTWARREAGGGGAVAVAAPSPLPSTVPAAGGAATAGRFAASVKETRAAGLHLIDVESTGGKVVLVYAGAAEAVEIALAADPKTGALVGTAALPRALPGDAGAQVRLEKALDEELAGGLPKAMTFGGPAGMKDLVTLTFASGRFLSIDPNAKDALVSRTVTP